MLLSVFGQAMTQVRNEESSAVEAMNAKLHDRQNGCKQKAESALRFCNVCSLQFALIGCPVSYDITPRTCLCNMQRFLKSIKWYFLDEKNNNFRIFAQKVDCGYTLKHPPVLCFRAKIRKYCKPMYIYT